MDHHKRRSLWAALALVAAVLVGALLNTQHTPWNLSNVPHLAGGSGTTYYLSTTGTDTGSCPSGAPCATLAYAAPLAVPGDTIQYDAGTYAVTDTIVTLNGSQPQPIIITGNGAATIERVTPLDATTPCLVSPWTTLSANSQCSPLLQFINSSWVTVEGLTLVGAKGQSGYNSAFTNPSEAGEVMFAGPDVIAGDVAQSVVVTGTNMGCVKGGGDGFAVISSTLTNCGPPATQSYPTYGGGPISSTQFHGIYFAGGGAGTIQGNTLGGSSGFGIHAHGTGMTGTVIMTNTVSGSHYAGILDDSYNPVEISGNLLHDNGWSITAGSNTTIAQNVLDGRNSTSGELHVLAGSSNLWVSKNTFMTINGGQCFQLENFAIAGPTTITNNIFSRRPYGSQALNCFGTGSAGIFSGMLTEDYNLFDQLVPGSGFVAGAHDKLATDPLFVQPNAEPYDLHLQGGSPAIDAGSASTLPSWVPWSGSAPDIGAYEYIAAPTATPTDTPAPTDTPGGPTNTPTATATATSTATATATPLGRGVVIRSRRRTFTTKSAPQQ